MPMESAPLVKLPKRACVFFTIGVGSPEGSVIPIEQEYGGTELVRDRRGEVVRSKLDEARLKEIAEAGEDFISRWVRTRLRKS